MSCLQVLVIEIWSANGACPREKFTMQDVLRYTAISHSVDVNKQKNTNKYKNVQ